MKRSLTINARIMLAALLPAISVVVLLSSYFVRSQLIHLDEALQERGQVIASQLAQAAEYGVFSGNRAILQNLAQASLKDEDVIRVIILSEQGDTLIDARSPQPADSHEAGQISFSGEILSSGVAVSDFDESNSAAEPILLGEVQVTLSRHSTALAKQRILNTSLLISLLVLSVGGLFALQTGRSLARPLHRLTQAASAVANGELHTRVGNHSRGELGDLEQGFNTMAARLEDTQRDLQQQVDSATRELRRTLEAVEIQNVQLDLARRHAQEVSREKTAFLANMSHEIRTPMNGLLGFIDLLLRTPLNAEQRDYTATIRKSASNLLVIVNDILDFSKIESNKLVIDTQPFNLREALEDSVDLMAPVAHDKNLELVLLIYSDVPLHLFGDSNRIRQVLLNLIGNAIKFTAQGHVIVRVMLDEADNQEDERAMIRINVTDTGIGLSETEQAHLFEAFSQLDNSPSRYHGGTGLGLFISKNLVEAMGGQIGVDSSRCNGATFWFSLPLKVQHDVTVLADESVLEQPVGAIIYDPHPLTRLALRHPLEAWGFQVDEAVTTETLLEAINPASHSIIIVSLAISTEQEQQTSRQLLQQLAAHQLPVIAMLNEIDADRLQAWCQAGASFAITKPVRRETLHRTLWQALQLPEEEDQHIIDRRKTPRPLMPNLTGARILLADDNEINRKLITLQLESLGVRVDTAINGEEAIWFARRNQYDLILMDLHMPGMSGDVAASEIRNSCDLNQPTPIIAITANIFSGESEQLQQHGINDYLVKPISEYSLWEMIKRWIGEAVEGDIPADSAPEADERQQDILRDLMNMLKKDLPEQRQQLAAAFKHRQWQQLREHAHKLHGSAAYCQASDLQRAAAALEQAAYNEDEQQIESAYSRCDRAIDALLV